MVGGGAVVEGGGAEAGRDFFANTSGKGTGGAVVEVGGAEAGGGAAGGRLGGEVGFFLGQ